MGLGYVTIGPKTYEIKRKRFTVWLGSGELVSVGGELALLLGRIFQGDYSRVWKGRKSVSYTHLTLPTTPYV